MRDILTIHLSSTAINTYEIFSISITTPLSILILSVCLGEHTQWCSNPIPGSVLKDHPWQAGGIICGARDQNPDDHLQDTCHHSLYYSLDPLFSFLHTED